LLEVGWVVQGGILKAVMEIAFHASAMTVQPLVAGAYVAMSAWEFPLV
jgi:hypothetical protein